MGNVNIKAAVSSLVPPGTPSPNRVNAPSSIRSPAGFKLFGGQLSNSLAGDLEGLSQSVNALHTTMQASPAVSQILLTNQAGQVTAAFGPVVFNGVPYTNYLSEIHVGNPLNTRDPTQALFNANLDGSVSIGQSGWLDVHDPFDGNAAWIGTQMDTLLITNAVNNGVNEIRLTVPLHTLITGNTATVRNMNLFNVPNAVGAWTVTVIDVNTVDLDASVWSGPFVPMADPPSGLTTWQPTIDRVLQISGVASAGGLIRIQTSIAHGYESGTSVNIPDPGPGGVTAAVGQWIISIPATLAITGAADNGAGLIRLTVPPNNFVTGDKPQILNVGGVPNANGYFVITVIDATHVDLQGSTFAGTYTSGGTIAFLHANYFDLVGSTFAGTYTSGGTVLEYFAGMLAQTVAIGPSFQNYKLRAFPSGDLRIRNASIELSSGTGQIILDPITAQISLTSSTSLAEIILDATVPSLTLLDQTGTPAVSMEVLTETPIAISSATNASPIVITMGGVHTYVNGDTILIQAATGNTVINGYRIVESLSAPGGTFHITDLQGHVLNGTGAYAGSATATRYYAGLLAQTLALGSSFAAYRLRFFADGTLKINNASIDASTITNTTINGGLTSTAGTAPNVLTLTIAAGLLSIAGTGTAAGTGTITIDGLMTAAAYKVGATAGADGPVSISGLTLNFAKGIYTGQSGAFSFATSGVTASVVISGLTLNFSNGLLATQSGAFSYTTSGFSGTATVRNSAGTGTSSFAIANGLVTGYTP